MLITRAQRLTNQLAVHQRRIKIRVPPLSALGDVAKSHVAGLPLRPQIKKTRPLPFPLVAMRGFPWDKFGVREKDTLRRGDHVFATRSQYGQYLAEMAPYWREIMQSGFLETPLMAGSLSLYGSDPTRHFEFATEICNEKLTRKYTVTRGRQTLTAWDWQTMGDNHYCDCLTGCFALASWYHCYDNLSAVIDGVITSPVQQVQPNGDEIAPHKLHQDDLFDPMRNQAVVAAAQYDGAADETEGTLDTNVEPFAGDVENLTSPFVATDAMPRAKTVKIKKRLHRIRRGKYRL